MLKIATSQITKMQIKHFKTFFVFLLLYAAILLALVRSGDLVYDHLHLLLDTGNGILSMMLAIFLLAEQTNIQPAVRKYLVIGFGFTAVTEILHSLVGVEWAGSFAWIATFSPVLRPATWSPSGYVLAISLLWVIWLMRRNSELRLGIFIAGMAVVTLALFLLATILPPYFDSGLLGVQRPTQLPLLFLWLATIAVCWRERHRSSLFEGLAWMGVLLFLSSCFMLFATSQFDQFTMMGHSGKLMAYIFLHVIQMRLAAEESRARMAAESALKQERQSLRDAMGDLVFHQYALDQHSIVGTTDVRGNILYVNESFVKISGYSREELIGQNHRLLNSGAHPTEFFRDMYRTIAAGKVWKGEICNRAKNGHLYWVITTIVPVLDENGKPKQYISMRSEVTAHKRVETELIRYRDHLEELVAEQTLDLKQAKESAEAASRSKSEFLANMSHEIRTPMNGVVGVIDILQETSLSSAQQRMVNTIRTSSLALLGILGDILDISKIEAGKLEVELIPVNLRELVEEVVQLLSPTVADKDMDLILFLPPEIPLWICTDPGRLRQILFNLLSNAVKFTQTDEVRRGQVLLRVELETPEEGREFLNFRIIDNGPGLAPETVAQLFQAFVQADATTTRRFGGTGLGLSISKHLAELMHGTVKVSSVLGSGSEFSLELPLELAPAGSTQLNLAELSGVKVMIVTDHPVYEELLPSYLRAAGAQIRVVGSLDAAMHEISQTEVKDWVLLLDKTRESVRDKEAASQFGKVSPDLPVVLLVSRRIGSKLGSEPAVMANPLLLEDLLQTLAIASRRTSVTALVQKTERRKQARKLAPSVKDAELNDQLILVAEDNEINREVIQEQLRILGYASEAGEDGLAALKMWRTGRYSLLFTDCHMPNLDGFGLTAEIRKEEPQGKRFPIIAVTANAMQGEVQRCISSGMDDYLSKPLRLGDIGLKLAKWLPQKQSNVAAKTESEARPLNIQTVNPAEDPVWDSKTLTRMVGDNPEMHRRLLDKFLLGAAGQVADIKSAAASGDSAAVAGVAHKMKSAARTVGAMRLGNLCQALEMAARTGDDGALHVPAAGLEAAFQEAAVQIKSSFRD